VKQLLLLLGLLLSTGFVQAFDHTHAEWDRLLARNVIVSDSGSASRVNYAGMLAERVSLNTYLAKLSAVTLVEYRGWKREQQLAFLINAYNAFTVELILTRYPDVESIKDLGSLFRSPWKRRFFTLLGKPRHLDNLEQDLIREPGVFDEPRIHFALNCASIGCPMLRNGAYVAARLDQQLEEGIEKFLSDPNRNRFDRTSGTLQLSKIFDWYEEDFTANLAGKASLKDYLSNYASLLAKDPETKKRLRTRDYRIKFLDYDWELNDQPTSALLTDPG
jgi:hypothetical protein